MLNEGKACGTQTIYIPSRSYPKKQATGTSVTREWRNNSRSYDEVVQLWFNDEIDDK